MKKIITLAMICAAALTQVTQAQNTKNTAQAEKTAPTQQQLIDANLQCMMVNMPANWDAAMVWLDRSSPEKTYLYGLSHAVGATKDKTLKPCSLKTQANLIIGFIPMIPAAQQNWKQLYVSIAKTGQYNVFTDIGLKAAQTKAK